MERLFKWENEIVHVLSELYPNQISERTGNMRKNKKITVIILIAALAVIILAACAAEQNYFREDKPSDDGAQAGGEQLLTAVYLQKDDGNSLFVNLEAEYPFTGTIPEGELYDEEGGKIKEQDLKNGDVVNIYGNGIMAESYPAQYHGITRIERTEQANQNYIQEYGHYLDEIFIEKDPAQLPCLNVCYSDEQASVSVMIPEALSGTWTYEENGESRTVTADASHVLQTEPTEVTKLAEPMVMELEFDVKPESVQIFSWDDSLLGQYQDNTAEIPQGTPVEVQENEKGNPEFTAQPGCVYLVQGQWENGTVDYGFRVPAK